MFDLISASAIEFFKKVAYSKGETALNALLTTSSYQEHLQRVFASTVTAFEQGTMRPAVPKGECLFYQSQTFFVACLHYRFYEDLEVSAVYRAVKADERIVSCSETDIRNFVALWVANAQKDTKLKAAFLDENYQEAIFSMVEILKSIKEGFDSHKNTITINGSHNLVLQDIRDCKDLVLALDKSDMKQSLSQQTRLHDYHKAQAAFF